MMSSFVHEWRRYVFNLDDVLEQLHRYVIVAPSIVPYPRITPAVFMDRSNYLIYSARDSMDLDVLRGYSNILCLQDTQALRAARTQSTTYLVRQRTFLDLVKSYGRRGRVLVDSANTKLSEALDRLDVRWIGNRADTFEAVLHKASFHREVCGFNDQVVESQFWSACQFQEKSFVDLPRDWATSGVVIQPGNFEKPGTTYFVRSQADFASAQAAFRNTTGLQTSSVRASPFVKGDAVSMLGCVTSRGILTSCLQLQLIDIPEVIHGAEPHGTFVGHDWGVTAWSERAAASGRLIVEGIGTVLRENGYCGAFGIDFMYDAAADRLIPTECNPRPTGALPVYSQLNLMYGVPPIEFFSMAGHLNINIEFDFDAVNAAWRASRRAASHIAILPLSTATMAVRMKAGVYRRTVRGKGFEYLRRGAFLHDLRDTDEFVIVDEVPRLGDAMPKAPRLMKLIFGSSIAAGSFRVSDECGTILRSVVQALTTGTE